MSTMEVYDEKQCWNQHCNCAKWASNGFRKSCHVAILSGWHCVTIQHVTMMDCCRYRFRAESILSYDDKAMNIDDHPPPAVTLATRASCSKSYNLSQFFLLFRQGNEHRKEVWNSRTLEVRSYVSRVEMIDSFDATSTILPFLSMKILLRVNQDDWIIAIVCVIAFLIRARPALLAHVKWSPRSSSGTQKPKWVAIRYENDWETKIRGTFPCLVINF